MGGGAAAHGNMDTAAGHRGLTLYLCLYHGGKHRVPGGKITCCLNALLFGEQLYDNDNDIAQDSEDPGFSSLYYFM